MLTTIKEDVPLSLGSYRTVGTIRLDTERQMLILSDPEEPDQIISTRLDAYGLIPDEDPTTVFVKDWSENEGLTASLVEAGVVEILRELTVGPFNSRVYEVRVLGAEAAAAAETKAA